MENMEELHLDFNERIDAGVSLLANTNNRRNLKRNFSYHANYANGLLIMKKLWPRSKFGKLEVVDRRGNQITKDKTVMCFAESGQWENFKTLSWVLDCHLKDVMHCKAHTDFSNCL